jgi:hypothetical protein
MALQGQSPFPRWLSEALYGPAPAPVAALPFQVKIETEVVGYEVLLNGVSQRLYNHQFKFPVTSPDAVLVVRRAGYNDYVARIQTVAGESIVVKPVFSAVMATGFLTYETAAAATLTLSQDGKALHVLQTPLVGHKLPVGTYDALLENSIMGYRHAEKIVIEDWKTTVVRKQLSGN